MSKKEVKQEKNKIIFKYQKENVNEKLVKILGDDFRKYRDEFNKVQDYQKTKFIPEFPLAVSLELINRCNLNCIMCFKPHHKKPKAELSLKTIEKILAECKENKLPSMILGLGSETLIYKDVLQVLDMVRQANIQDVFFGTNGVLLNDEIIKLIIKNKISRVEISIDAATAEIYNKVRRVPVFNQVEANVKKLVEYKKKLSSPLPIIRLCFVVMDINKHESEQFIEKWQNQVDYIDFQRFIDHSYVDKLKKLDTAEEKGIKDAFCSYPFYSLNIWANGDVSPCCTYYGKDLVLGNIHQQSLKELWQSQQIKTIRKQIVDKRFNLICKNCLYFRDRDIIEKNF